MYHQALDSSAQTTTATAQMPRPFVRGYDRQAVSRAQGGGVYLKGFSRMEGSGFSVGLVGNDEPPADMGGFDAMPFLARMARKKGYSQAQIDNFKQSRGSRGGSLFDVDFEALERRRVRDAELKAEKRARMTPEQRARAEKEDRQRERAGERYRNMTEGEKVRENVSAPFRKLGKSFDRSFGKIGKLF